MTPPLPSFGPPWTLPVGPLLSSLAVGNAGSLRSLAQLYLASCSLVRSKCGGRAEVGLMLSKVLVGNG